MRKVFEVGPLQRTENFLTLIIKTMSSNNSISPILSRGEVIGMVDKDIHVFLTRVLDANWDIPANQIYNHWVIEDDDRILTVYISATRSDSKSAFCVVRDTLYKSIQEVYMGLQDTGSGASELSKKLEMYGLL